MSTASRVFKKGMVCIMLQALFAIIMFVYFYFMQTPTLTLAQHLLSQGQTYYAPFLSSIVLTGTMILIQEIISRIFRFEEKYYLLSTLPVVTIATLFTAFAPQPNYSILAVNAIVLAFFIVATFIIKRKREKPVTKRTPIKDWTFHTAILTCNSLLLGLCSNSTDTAYYEMEISRYLYEQEYKQALVVGKESQTSSRELTALRAYAISKSGQKISNLLFKYATPNGGAENLLLIPTDSINIPFPCDSIYQHLGTSPKRGEAALTFLKRAAEKSIKDSTHIESIDYYLCGLLLERDLNTFCKELPRFYPNDSTLLPLHFAQAMLLQTSADSEIYPPNIDTTLIREYKDFIFIEQSDTNNSIRCANLIKKKKGNSYWWYYKYGNN